MSGHAHCPCSPPLQDEVEVLTAPPLPVENLPEVLPWTLGPSFLHDILPILTLGLSAVLTPPTCPVLQRPVAPVCVPDIGHKPQGPSSAPRPRHLTKPCPGPHLQSPHVTRGVLQPGRPPAREGRPPRPPHLPSRGPGTTPAPLPTGWGGERPPCPPGLPAGRQVSPQLPDPLHPNPQSTSAPMVSAGCGREGASPAWLWVGAGRPLPWTPGPAGQGAPPPVARRPLLLHCTQ